MLPTAGRCTVREMGTVGVVARSLSMLNARARVVVGGLVAGQAVVAVVALIGIMMVGLAVTAATGDAAQGGTTGVSARLGALLHLDASSPDTALTLAGLGGVLLLLTTALTYGLTRATFAFMAAQQANIAVGIMRRIMDRSWVFAKEQSSQEVSWVVIHGTRSVALGVLAQSVVDRKSVG